LGGGVRAGVRGGLIDRQAVVVGSRGESSSHSHAQSIAGGGAIGGGGGGAAECSLLSCGGGGQWQQQQQVILLSRRRRRRRRLLFTFRDTRVYVYVRRDSTAQAPAERPRRAAL